MMRILEGTNLDASSTVVSGFFRRGKQDRQINLQTKQEAETLITRGSGSNASTETQIANLVKRKIHTGDVKCGPSNYMFVGSIEDDEWTKPLDSDWSAQQLGW